MKTTIVTHNGRKLEVDFETEGDGSGPSYSPMYGADSGNPLIVMVNKVRDAETMEEVALSDDELDMIAADITAHYEYEPPDFDDNYM